jgi:hypothetical protein
MGYDIEFIVLKLPAGTRFPVDAAQAATLIAQAAQPLDATAVRTHLLTVPGCKAGLQDSVDYLGSGMSYARMTMKAKAIHVENNCGPKDVLKLQAALSKALGPVYILDLQSRQLHDADSFAQWWAKPL